MVILGVDVGTTSLKMGAFRAEGGDLLPLRLFSKDYEIRTYNDGLSSDIDPAKWKEGFAEGCAALAPLAPDADCIALSGTTPGLTAMDRDGNALLPAILMLDQRSRAQAEAIIDAVGLQRLLETTGNMPVAGGCSLASILWIRESRPEIFRRTHVFGHSNTYIARWLTGAFAIDPSSASLTSLYPTVRNDLTWDASIAETFGLSVDRLPPIIPSHASPGRVIPSIASELGLAKAPPVVIGGNDAVLAAYSLGIEEPGDIINVNGTCEITLVCLPRPIPSPRYNIRAHVIPERWLTLHVMNAGGKALEWFREIFCSEMGRDAFFEAFLPRALDAWLERASGVTYVPYLMGSRYSLAPRKAQLRGLTRETSREEILAAVVRGLCAYQRRHLEDIGAQIPLRDVIHVTGGAVSPALIRAKRRWMRDCAYVREEESSVKGAAMLGRRYLEERLG